MNRFIYRFLAPLSYPRHPAISGPEYGAGTLVKLGYSVTIRAVKFSARNTFLGRYRPKEWTYLVLTHQEVSADTFSSASHLQRRPGFAALRSLHLCCLFNRHVNSSSSPVWITCPRASRSMGHQSGLEAGPDAAEAPSATLSHSMRTPEPIRLLVSNCSQKNSAGCGLDP